MGVIPGNILGTFWERKCVEGKNVFIQDFELLLLSIYLNCFTFSFFLTLTLSLSLSLFFTLFLSLPLILLHSHTLRPFKEQTSEQNQKRFQNRIRRGSRTESEEVGKLNLFECDGKRRTFIGHTFLRRIFPIKNSSHLRS